MRETKDKKDMKDMKEMSEMKEMTETNEMNEINEINSYFFRFLSWAASYWATSSPSYLLRPRPQLNSSLWAHVAMCLRTSSCCPA